MRHSAKIALCGLAGSLFVLGVAGFFLKGALEATARKAIETVASDMSGTAVAYGALGYDFSYAKSGNLGLRVIKPDGFAGDASFKFDQVTFELAPIRTLANPTVVDLMEVNAPHITYHFTQLGEAGAAPPARFKARDFIIEKLVLRQGFLMIAAPGFERDFRVAIPDMELRDIGGDAGAATPGEAIRQIVADNLARANQDISESELADIADDIGRSLGELGDSLGDELKALGKSLGDAAKDTGKALQELFREE